MVVKRALFNMVCQRLNLFSFSIFIIFIAKANPHNNQPVNSSLIS